MPATQHQYGEFYSWTILNDNVALKKTDKSFFNHHGSGIPMEIRWFFRAEHFPDNSNDIPVSLTFEGKSYKGKMNLHKMGKVRIFWHMDLENELNKHYHGGEYPLARFEKRGQDNYNIEFIDEITIEKDMTIQHEPL